MTEESLEEELEKRCDEASAKWYEAMNAHIDATRKKDEAWEVGQQMKFEEAEEKVVELKAALNQAEKKRARAREKYMAASEEVGKISYRLNAAEKQYRAVVIGAVKNAQQEELRASIEEDKAFIELLKGAADLEEARGKDMTKARKEINDRTKKLAEKTQRLAEDEN